MGGAFSQIMLNITTRLTFVLYNMTAVKIYGVYGVNMEVKVIVKLI